MTFKLLYLCVFLGAALTTANGSYLYDGWFPLAFGYEYKVLFEKHSWEGARAVCQRWGGDLAVHGMKYFGHRLAIGNIFLVNQDVWIGLNDMRHEGTWKYVDHTPVKNGNAHWRDGQPNNRGNEDCGSIRKEHHFKATDNDCRRRFVALCERPYGHHED